MPSSSAASTKCPRSRPPLLSPARLLPLHHVPRARRTPRPLLRSRGPRGDRRPRTTIPHIQRHSLALALALPPRGRAPPDQPRRAHAPVPYRPRGRRHQTRIRPHCVRLHPSFLLLTGLIPRLAIVDQGDPHPDGDHRVRPSSRVSRAGARRARSQRPCRVVVASPGKETRGDYAEGGLRCRARRAHVGQVGRRQVEIPTAGIISIVSSGKLGYGLGVCSNNPGCPALLLS